MDGCPLDCYDYQSTYGGNNSVLDLLLLRESLGIARASVPKSNCVRVLGHLRIVQDGMGEQLREKSSITFASKLSHLVRHQMCNVDALMPSMLSTKNLRQLVVEH